MRPEIPFLAAGVISIIGGSIKAGGWPSDVGRSVLGTAALVLVTSATADTRIAPLVHAIGILLATATVIAAVNAARPPKIGTSHN